jgi:hypothetical protein
METSMSWSEKKLKSLQDAVRQKNIQIESKEEAARERGREMAQADLPSIMGLIESAVRSSGAKRSLCRWDRVHAWFGRYYGDRLPTTVFHLTLDQRTGYLEELRRLLGSQFTVEYSYYSVDISGQDNDTSFEIRW